MRGRYFRYLFKNLDGGFFHSGSVYDRGRERTINYIYMAGSECSKNSHNIETMPEDIDILIVGAYTAEYIKLLMDIVKKHRIETMVLPYLVSIQKLVFVEKVKDNSEVGKESARFLQDPYLYLKKFGNAPTTTVVMFEGPLHTSTVENDSILTEKEFSRRECCEAWQQYAWDSRCVCAIRCMYSKDHDVMKHHKSKEVKNARFGMLMLGNVNLNRYLSEIMARFESVWLRIRGISVPSCGDGEDWNNGILKAYSPDDRIYWICVKNEITSLGVVNDIVLSASSNRFFTVDEEWGCCFSGYLIPRADMD